MLRTIKVGIPVVNNFSKIPCSGVYKASRKMGTCLINIQFFESNLDDM